MTDKGFISYVNDVTFGKQIVNLWDGGWWPGDPTIWL